MLLTTVLALAAEETQLPVPPIVVGLGAFTIFCALILGVLMFGKGRPHS